MNVIFSFVENILYIFLFITFRVILLGLIATPWIIRVWVYYDSESELHAEMVTLLINIYYISLKVKAMSRGYILIEGY